VIAVERRAELVAAAGASPRNLTVVCADALAWPFPEGVTAGVLLMRHCHHFREYAERLRAAGARRLITNARWGMDVECVDLAAARYPCAVVSASWYACACGAVGFAPGPVDRITGATLRRIEEVSACPACADLDR
jgi:hypothetical protein